MNTLIVWHEQTQVGSLTLEDSEQFQFAYTEEWKKTGFPISQQLPLHHNFAAQKGRDFFTNLLPEAGARQHIITDLKIPNTDFALLNAIGGECAGALSILPENQKPTQKAHYKKLTDDELAIILRRKGNLVNLTSPEERPRLSLAGAQDKLPIVYKNESYHLPENNSPSTHILKFEVSDYKHIPAYEHFLNQLAKSINLPSVQSEFKQHENYNYLLIKRYDRIEGKITTRLHQEDFCQALGYSHANKYEQHGGPNFADCYKLTESVSSNPLTDCDNLLKWQIFNILAGNSDGHAKNLALLYKNGASLAPFYDLVCTRAIERIDSKLAFSIAREFNPDKITTKHWEAFAKDCGIKFQYLSKLIKELSEQLLENHTKVKIAFEEKHGDYPALQRVTAVIEKQCKKNLRLTQKP